MREDESPVVMVVTEVRISGYHIEHFESSLPCMWPLLAVLECLGSPSSLIQMLHHQWKRAQRERTLYSVLYARNVRLTDRLRTMGVTL